MPIYRKPEDVDDELHRLLLVATPPNQYGNKTIRFLATLIPVNRYSITRWIAKGQIAPKWVNRIVEISAIERYEHFDADGNPSTPVYGEPRVKREEFEAFVYNV